MRIFVGSAGDQPYHRAQREVFADLARADTVGEHVLEDDPGRADALLFVDLHQHPDAPFLRALRRHELVRRYRDKVYVYDERDQPFFTFPGIYTGGDARVARRRAMAGGPYPVLLNELSPTDDQPDLLYSFQGARTHPVRDAVLALSHPRAMVRDTSHINFFATSGIPEPGRETASIEFAQLVARSKFVLCPRGHGPSSFRLYETLGAGRVPVVISDNWLPPPRIDWSQCVVRAAERDVGRVADVLERLESRWPQMVAAGRVAFNAHFAQERLWHHYSASVAELAGRSRPVGWPWWAQEPVVRLFARHARAAVRSNTRRRATSA